MQTIFLNYQNQNKEYMKQLDALETERAKIEEKIAKAEKDLEELDNKFIQMLAPDFFTDLVQPLAEKLAEYYNKEFVLHSSYNRNIETAAIYLVDDKFKPVKNQPTFRITVCSYKSTDGFYWMAFDTGKTSIENGKRLFAPLPTKLEEIVKLLK